MFKMLKNTILAALLAVSLASVADAATQNNANNVSAAGNLTGSTLAAGVTASSLTSTGTLTGGATGAGFTVNLGASTISGILPAANGGAGTITGALKANGSGLVTQAACSDLSNATTACSTSIGTSGATLLLANGNNTYGGTANFTNTFSIGGTAETFPSSGLIVGTTDTQTLTNKSIAGSEINSGTVAAARLPQAAADGLTLGAAAFNSTDFSCAAGVCDTIQGISSSASPSFAGETLTGNLTLSTHNLVTDTTTGTKIGTATGQKLGFYNATPVVQPSGDIITALTNLGLIATPSIGASDLPLASSSAVGGVKGDGSTLTINGSGVISCTTGSATQLGCLKVDGTTITASSGIITAVGGSATAVTVGTTTIGGGTNTKVEMNNSGVLGEYAVSGTGSVCMTTNCSMTTPALGTPSAVVLTNATGTAASLTAGNATTLATARNINGVSFNGSANIAVPALDSSQVNTYTSSTTWTKPAIGTIAHVEIWSGGASGASRTTTGNAGGGGGGGYYDLWIPLSALASTETVTVGASVAGVSGNSNGNNGNSSSFTINGVALTVNGGSGGNGGSGVVYAAGTGYVGAQGAGINNFGAPLYAIAPLTSLTEANVGTTLIDGGVGADSNASLVPVAGGNCINGGGGGGASSSTSGGVRTGGSCPNGGAGGAGGAYTGGNGTSGSNPSGGGGGAVQGGTSGGGARGQVRVTVF
jgi:hypothetical protein